MRDNEVPSPPPDAPMTDAPSTSTAPSTAAACRARSGAATPVATCCRCGSPTWTSPRRRPSSTLHRRIDHGVSGYTDAWPALEQAVVEGLQRDHGWTIQPDWLVGCRAWSPASTSPAPSPASGRRRAHRHPGISPFLTAPANTGRVLQRAELVLRDGRWQWDWDALEAARPRPACCCCAARTTRSAGVRRSRTAPARRLRRAPRPAGVLDEIHCGLVLDADRPHRPLAALDEARAAHDHPDGAVQDLEHPGAVLRLRDHSRPALRRRLPPRHARHRAACRTCSAWSRRRPPTATAMPGGGRCWITCAATASVCWRLSRRCPA